MVHACVAGRIGQTRMEINTRQGNHAVDAVFQPTAGLLERYNRYADESEYEDIRVQLDGLRQTLLLAQSHSDIYEAFCARNELRELHRMIEEVIALHKRQRSF
jgi:hypothetical protein